MYCPKCGNDNAEGLSNCIYCGAVMQSQTVASTQDMFTVQKAPNMQQMPNAQQTPYMQPNIQQTPDAQQMTYVQNSGKGKGKKVAIGISAVVVGVIALVAVAGIFIAGNMFKGPMYSIASATNRTLSSESFTAEFEVDMQGETAQGTALTYFDLEERILECYMEIENDDYEYVYGIYDGYMIVKDVEYGTCYKTDISEQLDEMFDSYEETTTTEEIDWEELLTSIDEDAYEQACEVIDFDILNECILSYAELLNDADWLEENANYSKHKSDGVTFYCFEPDLYDFSSASLECFEGAFVNSDDYDGICDGLSEYETELSEFNTNIEFGVMSGYLHSMAVDCSYDGEEVTVDINFTYIGETELPTDELEDLLNEAEEQN